MAIATYFHPQSLTASAVRRSYPGTRSRRSREPSRPGSPLLLRARQRPDGLRGVGVTAGLREYGPVLMPILHKVGIDPGTPDIMPIHNLAS